MCVCDTLIRVMDGHLSWHLHGKTLSMQLKEVSEYFSALVL